VIETEPSVRDVRFLQERLYDYNAEQIGCHDGQWLSIFLRDDAGTIVAGLHGWTWAGCLKVSDLWVHEGQRGQGHGSRLLAAAEAEARARGCTLAFLDTHSFQAPAFYEKHGYRIVSTIEDLPPGHRTYNLSKSL
jgi:ribosomal protein S18 acetylase RimI-like enzyme